MVPFRPYSVQGVEFVGPRARDPALVVAGAPLILVVVLSLHAKFFPHLVSYSFVPSSKDNTRNVFLKHCWSVMAWLLLLGDALGLSGSGSFLLLNDLCLVVV